MTTLQKIDNFLFTHCENLTRRWVRKKKFKQHKYDLMLKIERLELSYWVAYWLFTMGVAVVRHHAIALALIMPVAIMLVGLAFFNMSATKDMKDWYDILFMNRKHPDIYKAVKEASENGRESSWPQRRIMIIAFFGIMIVQSFLVPFLVPLLIPALYRLYVTWIFDFDEPDEKKKAKDSLTERAMESFRNLVRGMNPQGV